MDARSFLDTVTKYGQEAIPTSANRINRLAVIDPAYTTGKPKVTFDGDLTLSVEGFPFLNNYQPEPDDRVVMMPIGNTYVILGKADDTFLTHTHTFSIKDITGGPAAFMYQSSNQSLTNGTWTSILLQSEDFDTHAGHSTSVNTSRWTCPTGWAGYYLVTGLVYFATSSVGVRASAVAKNGTRQSGSIGRVSAASDGGGNGLTVTPILTFLDEGDYVEIQGVQTSGGSINTSVAAPDTSGMSVMFVRA